MQADPGLKLDHPRLLAVMHALVRSPISPLVFSLSHDRCVHSRLDALGADSSQYRWLRSIHLSKLRATGLIARFPFRRYRLVGKGIGLPRLLKCSSAIYTPLRGLLNPLRRSQTRS